MPAIERKRASSLNRTRVFKPIGGRLGKKELQDCVEILEQSGVIIFPTDTVYGMACRAFSHEGVDKIYSLKGRIVAKPLPVFLSDAAQLSLVATEIPKEALILADKFWPGPLTLVFRTASMALHVVRGKSTIAVRIPDHGAVQQILSAARVPLAVTSANLSGKPSIKTGQEAIKHFRGRVDAIVDGGPCRIGRESTVLEASRFPFSVVRQGAISKEILIRALNL